MTTETMTADESAAMEAMKADAPVVEVPEAVSAPVPAVVEAPAPVAVPEAEPQKTVPHQALHEAREETKEVKRQLQELQRQLQALQQPPVKEPEIVVPDPILDPEGFKKFQIDQIKQREQERQQTLQEQQFAARMYQDEQQFKAVTPDFEPAVKFAIEHRQRELAFYGYAPEQINAQIQADIRGLSQHAVSKGENAAKMIYEYAKLRGYSGPVAAPAPATPAPPSPADAVRALAASQAATASMATAGGPANDGGPTLESIAKMSEKELAAMPRAKRDEMMRKVMGG